VEAKVGGSSAEMLTKHAVLLADSLELAPRPSILTALDFHARGHETQGSSKQEAQKWCLSN